MSLAAKIFQRIRSWRRLERFLHLSAWSAEPSSGNEGRFYPESIAKHKDEPTKDKLFIATNPLFGQGVMAKSFFRKGDLLFRFDGAVRDDQTLFTLQKEPGVYIEDPYLVGKILHSCDPNAAVDMSAQLFWAEKDIKPGDFITMDYESTEDELFRSFPCRCGAADCRGLISGKKARERRPGR